MSPRPSRESIFAALFSKLQSVSGLVTSSRILKAVQDMSPSEMSAAFQLQGKQMSIFKGSTPTVGEWKAQWIFYAYSDSPATAPSTKLNNLIDGAYAVLAPGIGGNKQTLGGLVEYAAIVGEVEIFEGLLGDRAVALLPIHIVVPGF